MRLFSKDPMDRKLDPAASSYWQKREPQEDASISAIRKTILIAVSHISRRNRRWVW